MGAALVGLAPPLAFLVATTGEQVGVAMATLALCTAAMFGLGALHRAIFAGQIASLARDGLFLGWAVVALGIGARLFANVAIGGAS
jgi:hypothetical protein